MPKALGLIHIWQKQKQENKEKEVSPSQNLQEAGSLASYVSLG
jgi:hypothetical protein